MVYVTPERMFPGDGSQPDPTFTAMASARKLGLIAIDEAHCIFSWQCFRYMHARSLVYVLIYIFINTVVFTSSADLPIVTYWTYLPISHVFQ